MVALSRPFPDGANERSAKRQGRSFVTSTSLTPVLFRALHSRRSRVLHFEPIGRAAGTVSRVLPLRHDAFETTLQHAELIRYFQSNFFCGKISEHTFVWCDGTVFILVNRVRGVGDPLVPHFQVPGSWVVPTTLPFDGCMPKVG
jgi:hypothetical protein